MTRCVHIAALCALLLLGAVLAPVASFAQSDPLPTEQPQPLSGIFLDDVIHAEFSPQQVFYLVGFNGQNFQRLEAVLTPPFSPAEAANRKSLPETSRAWRAGVQVAVPVGASSVQYAVIIVGEGNRFSLIPPRSFSLDDRSLFRGSIDVLREELIKAKSDARSWETQVQAQDDSLKRLRSDADVIADLGRIVDVRDEIDRTNQAIRGLEQDQTNLEQFLTLARSRPAPRNFAARERQLTKQISELVDAAKATEAGELSRRSDAERGLQEKLAVIERARSLDIDLLQRELSELRSGEGIAPDSGSHTSAVSPERGAKPEAESQEEAPEDYLR